MTLEDLLEQLRHDANPAEERHPVERDPVDRHPVEFGMVQEIIQRHYHYTPTAFSNGVGADTVDNPAGSNEGSCRIFAFAQRHQLTEAQTLACFGHFYRDLTADGTDHGNIRTFMRHGWAGIRFSGTALTPRTA